MMSSRRQPPFDNWDVQYIVPHYGYVWFGGEAMLVSHLVSTHGDTPAVDAYHELEEAILERYEAKIEAAGGLYAVHDWRAAATYDREARLLWQQKMRERPRGYLRGSTVCVNNASPFMRMAISAGNLVAAVSQGAEVIVSTSVEETLATLRLSKDYWR